MRIDNRTRIIRETVIRERRLDRRLVLRDVGRSVGLSAAQVSRIEQRRSRPSTQAAQRLASFYRISLDEMLDPEGFASWTLSKGRQP